jgi:DNA ligase-1
MSYLEGLIKQRRNSPILAGRKGHWWKWKIDPLTVDAVMIYAQPDRGVANLFTDFTLRQERQSILSPSQRHI